MSYFTRITDAGVELHRGETAGDHGYKVVNLPEPMAKAYLELVDRVDRDWHGEETITAVAPRHTMHGVSVLEVATPEQRRAHGGPVRTYIFPDGGTRSQAPSSGAVDWHTDPVAWVRTLGLLEHADEGFLRRWCESGDQDCCRELDRRGVEPDALEVPDPGIVGQESPSALVGERLVPATLIPEGAVLRRVDGEPAKDDVVIVYSRGRFREAKVESVGPKNAKVYYTTPSAVEWGQKHGHAPMVTSKTLPKGDVYELASIDDVHELPLYSVVAGERGRDGHRLEEVA